MLARSSHGRLLAKLQVAEGEVGVLSAWQRIYHRRGRLLGHRTPYGAFKIKRAPVSDGLRWVLGAHRGGKTRIPSVSEDGLAASRPLGTYDE